MPNTRATIRAELAALISQGQRLHLVLLVKVAPETLQVAKKAIAKSEAKKQSKGEGAEEATPADTLLKELENEGFASSYQHWYSQALRVVKQLLPDRYAEFRELHRLDKNPKLLNPSTYTLSDYTQGIVVSRGYLKEEVFNATEVALKKFENQLDILRSAEGRLDSLLADITGVIEANLLDDELSAAQALLKAKHLRSAGVVAGVVLERHLKRLITNHQVTFRKVPQIASLNDALKAAKIYDVPQWRRIQALGDFRNLCAHHGEHEPTGEEVDELIVGVEKATKTVS
jgi:hypothetical protein